MPNLIKTSKRLFLFRWQQTRSHSPGTSANEGEEIRSIWSERDDSKCNQTLLTIQNTDHSHNSIQFGRRDISTATQTRKHPFIICMGKRGRRIEDQHQFTYRIIMYSLEGAIYPAYYCHIISAHHSENTFRNVVDLRFRCLTAIFSC